MEIAVTAVTLAVLLAIIAIISIRFQFKTYHKLKTSTLASDDRRFFRGQLQRRSMNAVLMLILAGLLGGAFLSGAQQKLDEILVNKQNDPQGATTEEEKDFVRTWTVYWMTTLGFLFFVVLIAITLVAHETLSGPHARFAHSTVIVGKLHVPLY